MWLPGFVSVCACLASGLRKQMAYLPSATFRGPTLISTRRIKYGPNRFGYAAQPMLADREFYQHSISGGLPGQQPI